MTLLFLYAQICSISRCTSIWWLSFYLIFFSILTMNSIIFAVNIHKNGQNRIFAPMTPVPFPKMTHVITMKSMLLSFDWIICIFLRCLFYRVVIIVRSLGIGIMDAIGFPGNSTWFEGKRVRWFLAKGFVLFKVCKKATFIDIWMLCI